MRVNRSEKNVKRNGDWVEFTKKEKSGKTQKKTVVNTLKRVK